MKYSHQWFYNGVITRYKGNASLEVLIRSQAERDRDIRFQKAEFLMVDATEVAANDIDLSSSHIMGWKAHRAWVTNHDLHVLLVSNSEIMSAVLDAYCAYIRAIGCPWKFSKFHYIEEAIEVVNRLYNCELNIKDILTDQALSLDSFTELSSRTHGATSHAQQHPH